MKNYQVYAKQIKQNNQVCGYITLCKYDYGFVVQLHFFMIPGYIEKQCFPTKEKAERFFNKLFDEYNY